MFFSRSTFVLLAITRLVSSSGFYVPHGRTLKVQLSTSVDTQVFLKVNPPDSNQEDACATTADVSAAADFMLDVATGYLFTPAADLQKYPSGYAVVYAQAFLGVFAKSELLLLDGDAAFNTTPSLLNPVTPWKCALDASIGAGAVRGALSCLFPNTILNSLSICAAGNPSGVLQAFATTVYSLLGLCSASSQPSQLVTVSAAVFVDLGGAAPGPASASTSSNLASTTVAAPAATSSELISTIAAASGGSALALTTAAASGGSCSVTLIAYVTTETVWVTAGAVPTGVANGSVSSSGDGSGHATSTSGGGQDVGAIMFGTPGQFGCVPVTSLVPMN